MVTSTPVLPSMAQVLEHFIPVGGVVVGDDGTATSRAAVRWAAADAVRRGGALHVVRAWSLTTAPRPRTWAVGYVPPFTDFEDAVREELARSRRPLVADLAGLDVHCTRCTAGPRPSSPPPPPAPSCSSSGRAAGASCASCCSARSPPPSCTPPPARSSSSGTGPRPDTHPSTEEQP